MDKPKPTPFPGLAPYLERAGVDPLYRGEAIQDSILLKVADLIGQALARPEHGRDILTHAELHAEIVLARSRAIEAALHDALAAIDAWERWEPPAEPEAPEPTTTETPEAPAVVEPEPKAARRPQ